ncbi:MAG: DNA helicase UvrD [Candidatus Jacksonbacteria bacterium]|jgi:uncharacterized protein (TIGR00375 family)|nr:DNA helicase UvrD [Candidatus Jacksonbacteria bacterium]MBT6301681.1 DNA helicase UvrD [Candidatus Jacksonbacteria bacterium]MBT6757169.1 DNA helicase UvrD [Candidatus Jacksonbacteria bacterium]MBT6955366.1 DNA helicase UvrD [Candidatus Jacksonbacteria bacterium]MBT7008707.1 DNA helicase UvrD [Candidatus Jacksonbacteria bacterium]
MEYITDLHLHSKYSRACSKNLDLAGNTAAGRKKGIQVIGTGDFTHPEWFKELTDNTEDLGNGLLKYKESTHKDDPVFMLTQEISCIYSKNGKMRRNHIVITAPSLKVVGKIADALGKIGNISSDGRPILGMSSEELAKTVLDISEKCLIIPAHIWTPWFSTFGSKSGYDSLEECFGEVTKYIYAFESGLSSDPEMNRRVKELDGLALVSNGDAHSPPNLGREATVFNLENLSYSNIYSAIKESKMRGSDPKLKNKISYTIEFYPEEGKYHWDGHRDCKVRLSPEETIKCKEICPKCKKKVTVGVEARVEGLATRSKEEVEKIKDEFTPYKSLIPLEEVISEVVGVGKKSKTVQIEYERILKENNFSEFDVLLHSSLEDLKEVLTPEEHEAIKRMRNGDIQIEPGYDGEYGTVKIFKPEERDGKAVQSTLF